MLDYLILESDWASVTEWGEEYELWLLDYSKTQYQNVFTVKLNLEIRRPSTLGKGDVVASKKIKQIHREVDIVSGPKVLWIIL